MSEPSKLNVEIYGHIYTLRVTPEEKAQVEAITAHVDQMMHKVGDDQTRLDYRDVAVLAAMNITEEYFKLQREYQELLSIVDEEK
ncbi:MAG: cell division protein ZapA [Peptococcaceae bacterium]